ncbi:MAG: sodium:proton antiporter [Negativicutes bacterium]|nr:sodium:proton antiporter [Negativicutes bacterium]
MGSEAIQVAQGVLLTFAALFLAGALAAKLAGFLKIPDVVLFLLIGIVVGPPCLNIINVPAESPLNQLLLILGASFLLFHGGMSVSFGVLKKTWLTISLLATVAVLIMVAIVGYTAHYILGVGLMSGLLLAAVLASTDPATLVPIFLAIKVKDKVAHTVLSESAFNDATGAIVTFGILGIIATGQFSLSDCFGQFAIMSVGGILIGVIFGLLSAFILCDKSRHFFGEYAQVMLLPLIILSYVSADYLGASGFMAVFVAGLIHGNMNFFAWRMHVDHVENYYSFIDNGSLLLRMIIFILLGAHVDFTIVKQILWPGCAVIAVFMFIARPLAVLVCTLPDRRAEWTKNEIIFMFWTRETGVIPAALSGMLIGMDVQHADIIAALTFIAILATLIIQASTTKWLAAKLDLLELN